MNVENERLIELTIRTDTAAFAAVLGLCARRGVEIESIYAPVSGFAGGQRKIFLMVSPAVRVGQFLKELNGLYDVCSAQIGSRVETFPMQTYGGAAG